MLIRDNLRHTSTCACVDTFDTRGGISQLPQTGNDFRHSFDEVIVVDLYHQASHLLDELCRASDDKLFASITNNREHVLHELLPPQSVASQNYNLRPHKHHFELPNKTSHLTDCNFMQRMLFLETYRRVIFILFYSSIHLSSSHTFKYCTLCVLTEFNKIHDDDDDDDLVLYSSLLLFSGNRW